MADATATGRYVAPSEVHAQDVSPESGVVTGHAALEPVSDATRLAIAQVSKAAVGNDPVAAPVASTGAGASASGGTGAGASAGASASACDTGLSTLTLKQAMARRGEAFPRAWRDFRTMRENEVAFLPHPIIMALAGHAVVRNRRRAWNMGALLAAARSHTRSFDVSSTLVSFDHGPSPAVLPIAAIHPVFRDLAAALHANGEATAHPQVSEAMFNCAQAFCKAMQACVKEEAEREGITACVATHLSTIFTAAGLPFSYDMYVSNGSVHMADIVLVPHDGSRESVCTKGRPPNDCPPCAIVEVKGEFGSSGDPWPQLWTYYADHVCRTEWVGVREDVSETMRSHSAFPMVLTAVNGHYMGFGGGIITTKPTTQRLGYSMATAMTGDSYHPARVAANLVAWAHAIDAVAHELLETRAATLSGPAPAVAMAQLSFPTLKADGERVWFIEHLARGVFRAMWRNGHVVVKVCRVNNDEAQGVLSGRQGDERGAPAILHSEDLRGVADTRWRVLVMEDLWTAGFDTLHVARERGLGADDEAAIRAVVLRQLEVLHEHGYVFFDVRPPNIMVRNVGEVWQVQLVDFEMCGKVGEPRPLNLNSEIKWPEATRRNEHGRALLSTSDDVAMLGQTFSH